MNTLLSSVSARFAAHVALLGLLTLSCIAPATAAGFGERFRSFVLGTEAQASTRHPGLDSGSQACLQCHDGARAAHITARTAGSPLPIRGSQTLDHPVGMVYDWSVAKDPQGYKPRAALHPNVRLVDGQVGCVTCHETRTDLTLAAASDQHLQLASNSACTATKQLTMGRRDHDLCLACHIK